MRRKLRQRRKRRRRLLLRISQRRTRLLRLRKIPGRLALRLAAAFGIGLISASSFYLLDIKQGNEPVQFIVQEVLATFSIRMPTTAPMARTQSRTTMGSLNCIRILRARRRRP